MKYQRSSLMLLVLFLALLLMLPTPSSRAADGTPTAAMLPPNTYMNPVFDRDFPDPDVLRVGNTFYAFATNTDNINIQAARSTDLIHWELIGDALPTLPTWAVQEFGYAWAPEVTMSRDGKTYLMYFVARFAIDKGGTQCIGLATSDQPEGYYQPTDAPLICQVSQGGSIDASTFVDSDGTPYILWKNDGNSGNGQTWLYIQRLSDDGLSLLDEPIKLLTADKVWEGVLVEAPTLWKQGNKYYLFYSANAYNNPAYAVGYAVANAITGPYTKPKKPILASSVKAGLVGPGGQDIVLDDADQTWMLYHNWAPGGYRRLNLVRLDWVDGIPTPVTSTRDPQSVPMITP